MNCEPHISQAKATGKGFDILKMMLKVSATKAGEAPVPPGTNITPKVLKMRTAKAAPMPKCDVSLKHKKPVIIDEIYNSHMSIV
jgi:hypothetical protein